MFVGLNLQVARTAQIFKQFDRDGDFRLSKEEAVRYFVQAEKLDETEAGKMFQGLDKDRDGYLT